MEELINVDKRSVSSIEHYETLLSSYFGAKFCIAVSSGTAAIIVALHAVGVRTGNEVITSPVAPLCTAYPIMHCGANLVFADIQNDNLGLDFNSLSENICDLTQAIIEVPMWGYPINGLDSKKFADKHSIPLIFDLAHCIGTEFGGKPLSTFCDIACFSTQKNKIFSTGEGGFILTNNESYYRKALMFSRMGNLNGIDFGINFKLSPILAVIGIAQIQNLHSNLKTRVDNVNILMSLIKNPKIKEIRSVEGGTPNYQRLLLTSNEENASFSAYLKANGVETDMEKYNIKVLYAYPILDQFKNKCSNAEQFISRTVAIPIHCFQDISEIVKTASIINNF